MAVPPEDAGHADFCIPAIFIGPDSRIFQIPGIDPGHDPEGFGRDRLVVEGGFRQTQQLALTPDRELWMILIDQSAQFMGGRGAETFF